MASRPCQALHIQEQAKALDEVRREGQQDIAQAYRLNYAAERRAATMQVTPDPPIRASSPSGL